MKFVKSSNRNRLDRKLTVKCFKLMNTKYKPNIKKLPENKQTTNISLNISNQFCYTYICAYFNKYYFIIYIVCNIRNSLFIQVLIDICTKH